MKKNNSLKAALILAVTYVVFLFILAGAVYLRRSM